MTSETTLTSPAAPVLDRIVGQLAVVQFLRACLESPLHAYLFVGPPGTGRKQAASVFAAALFCPEGGCGVCEICEATLAGNHPDLVVVERRGASILVPQAAEVVRLASRSPRAAPYQVLVLVDFHLLGSAAPSLLKTIEEPPESTIIVVTAESVPADFVTIASRCARVDFRPLSPSDLASALVAEGVGAEDAKAVATASKGRLDRARAALADGSLVGRLERWRAIPGLLDGSGATVSRLAEELASAAAATAEVLRQQHTEELVLLAEAAKAAGERGIAGRAEIEARHRREERRARTDDLLAGLATLAEVYQARIVAESENPGKSHTEVKAAIRAIDLIDQAATRLMLNVNEGLLLEWLFVELGETP
jgi:DNA polymerase-3 subunit delta'